MNESDVMISIPNGMDAIKEDEQSENDLSKLMKLSLKLHLSTKRRSVLQWKQIIEEKKRNGLLGKAILTESSILSRDGQENDVLHDDEDLSRFEDNLLLQVVDENANLYDTEELKSNSTKCALVLKETELLGENPVSVHERVQNDKPLNGALEQTAIKECDRRRKIDEALSNIRKDLILMRMEDHSLARKLLNIRENMNRQRAALTCEEHAEMLDHFTWEIEEEKEIDEKHKMSDLSSALLRRPDSLLRSPSILRQMGISKTTYVLRRFSVV